MKHAGAKKRTHQAGGAAVEFALVVLFFLTFIFAILELARVEYMVNTLMEVTRRAATEAATVNFRSDAALLDIQARAVFRKTAGPLALGDPVKAENVKIDYLSVSKDTMELRHVSALPSCPARNRRNCATDPYADNCIRFVRARICASVDNAGNCQALPYQKVFPFLDLSGMSIPIAESIVPAGSLGHIPGAPPCS